MLSLFTLLYSYYNYLICVSVNLLRQTRSNIPIKSFFFTYFSFPFFYFRLTISSWFTIGYTSLNILKSFKNNIFSSAAVYVLIILNDF